MKKRPAPVFQCTLQKPERILGFCFLAVHILLLPLLKGLMREFLPGTLSDAQWNTLRFLVSFLLILCFMRPMLFRDWDRLWDFRLPCFLILVPSHLVCIGLSLAVSLLLLLLPGDTLDMYDQLMPTIAGLSSRDMLVPMVLLAPLVEETLFRGVVFGSIREKNRAAAYIVSTALHIVCVVLPYALLHPDMSAVVYALQELPFAFALAWCYERTGTVFSPMLYHALYNLVPILFQIYG